MRKVLFVALLAIVAVAAADVEADAEKPKAKAADATAEKAKTFRPHMHRKGELRPGHVAPFPGGYNAAAWRSPSYRNGGVAPTTEQLLKRFPGADKRVPVRVPSAERSPSGYDWETPEYEFEYAARTGEDMGGRRAVRRSRAARQNLPVVHYPRRGSKLPRGARRARTPRAEGKRARKAKAQAKAKAQPKAQAKAGAAQPPKRSSSQRLDRLEKVMTFALRQLKRNLKRSKRLETFAVKSKRAINLIAKALSGDEKQQKLSASHVELLRAAALKTKTQLENLHARAKSLAAIAKEHKSVIKTIASEVVKTQKTQNNIVDNVNALRATAKATESALKNLNKREKATLTMLAAHAKKIVQSEKDALRTEGNVKALHHAAVNAQKAILNLDARAVKSKRVAKKETKALSLAFGAIKQLAQKAKTAKKH